MYGVSASYAAMASGAMVVLASASGQIIGGIWVGKASPSVKTQLIFSTSMLSLSFFTKMFEICQTKFFS